MRYLSNIFRNPVERALAKLDCVNLAVFNSPYIKKELLFCLHPYSSYDCSNCANYEKDKGENPAPEN